MLDLFPLLLSFKVATLATVISLGLGVGIAWLLARRRFPGKDLVDALVTLPMVLPPTVLGYYLLVTIGRRGPLGSFLEGTFGVTLVFTWQAAVIAAAVASAPLLIKAARAAFEGVDRRVEDAARTLGRSELSIFFTITIPLAWRGIMAGTILAFARALGDFGTTIMVAGNIPGKTQTMPIAVYDAVLGDNTPLANALVLVTTITAVVVLIALNRLERSAFRGNRDARS